MLKHDERVRHDLPGVIYAFALRPRDLAGRMMLSRPKNHRCCGSVIGLQYPPHSRRHGVETTGDHGDAAPTEMPAHDDILLLVSMQSGLVSHAPRQHGQKYFLASFKKKP